MARNPYYIYELPFQPRRELCRILDADRRWEELGGIHMHIDVTTLKLIGQAIHRDKSPTWELLDKYSERNGTIKHLFVYLAKMDHQRAMSVLLPYVDEKYHKLIHTDVSDSTSIGKTCETGPYRRPILTSFASMMETGITCTVKGSNSLPSQGHPHAFLHRPTRDVMNINESMRTLSVNTKLNSLNQHQQSRTNHSSRLSPDIRNVRADGANCDESNTDNCASEKMGNIPQSSQNGRVMLPEKDKNGKAAANSLEEKFCGDLKSLEKSLPDIMKISYKEILKATDEFVKNRILGRGGFGAVYKGEWKGIDVAIKRLMPREGGDSVSRHLVSLKQSLNELTILKCCRFDHILPLYGVSLDGPEPCLVYQLMVNGSLEDRLLCRNNTPPLNWSQRSSIAECTAKGLNYLHTALEKPLVHGDIKCANILLDANMEAKIGDFGLTREGPDSDNTHIKVTKLHGTECYLPPEYLRHRQLSPQVDVYSYGVVLLEMATGLRPYDSKREEKLLVFFVSDCRSSGRLDSIRDARAGEENMMWFMELLNIGQECCNKDKNKRPTINRVLEFFRKSKEELSMNDNIRRLSNDRSGAVDTSILKQCTPIALQRFYDMCKEKQIATGTAGIGCGASNASSYSPAMNSPPMPNDVNIPVPVLTMSQAECEQTSKVRQSSTASGQDPRIYAEPTTNAQLRGDSVSSSGASAGAVGCNENTSIQSQGTSSSDEQVSDNKVPLPMLTILHIPVSEMGESSCNFEPSGTRASISDISKEFSSIDYSMGSEMS